MSRERYLIDTSVLARQHRPTVATETNRLSFGGLIAVCSPVMFEIGNTARTVAGHELLMHGLRSFGRVPVSDSAQTEALDIQADLVERGAHRSVSLVDALVATTAKAHDLTVLHYDSDFELLAEICGCRQQWIVPAGTADT